MVGHFPLFDFFAHAHTHPTPGVVMLLGASQAEEETEEADAGFWLPRDDVGSEEDGAVLQVMPGEVRLDSACCHPPCAFAMSFTFMHLLLRPCMRRRH
jgi:hypothetical protein